MGTRVIMVRFTLPSLTTVQALLCVRAGGDATGKRWKEKFGVAIFMSPNFVFSPVRLINCLFLNKKKKLDC